ncbi:MFS transporter, partial [Pseudanabaena sp. CCNP1317]|uniref:MFS transporter n=1 Tax=Pseudanabaena sp. CCNP1317 TaxID=3110253 RepID=UPI002B207D3A
MSASPLGQSSFTLYLAVNFISLNGLWINRIVVGWLAWAYTGSAAWVGLVSSLLFAPTLLAGPFFGVIADRIDIKRGAMATQAMLGAIMLALLLVHTAGALDICGLTVIAFLFGLTQSANHPIRLTLVPLLVPQEEIPRAITVISINFNIARLIGPALGGLLIDGFSPGTAMLVSVLATLPMLVAFRFISPRPRASKAKVHRPLIAELADGAWHLEGVTRYLAGMPAESVADLSIPTNLRAEFLGESLAPANSIPIYELPGKIAAARSYGVSANSYAMQFHRLIAQPALLAAMTLIAAMVSLKFVRFGQSVAVILGGIGNPYGAIAGALIVGISQEVATTCPVALGELQKYCIGTEYKLGVGLVIMILV